MAELLLCRQAIPAVFHLHHSARWLYDAILTTKQNDKTLRQIAETVCIRAPLLRKVLLKLTSQPDPHVSDAFRLAIQVVVREMETTRLMIYQWLLKDPVSRVFTAPEMKVALLEVHSVLRMRLDDLVAFQVDDIHDRLTLLQATVNNTDSRIRTYASRIDVLVRQLGNLLETTSAQHSTERTILIAKATIRRAKQGYLGLKGHKGCVHCVVWNPRGGMLATAAADNTIAIWDALTGQRIHTMQMLKVKRYSVTQIAWSPSGDLIAAAYKNDTVETWEPNTGRYRSRLTCHTGAVHDFAWSPDGHRLATASEDCTSAIWDTSNGQPSLLPGHKLGVVSVAWSPGGRMVATASLDSTAGIWDSHTCQRMHLLSGHKDSVQCVEWSPDGSMVATASSDKTAGIWDARSGLMLHLLTCHGSAVRSVSWSPVKRMVATCAANGRAGIWDITTGQWVHGFEGQQDGVRHAVWSPDGCWVATTSHLEDTVCVWDDSGRCVRTLEGHGDKVVGAAWSPDGIMLATASKDGTAAIWDGRMACF